MQQSSKHLQTRSAETSSLGSSRFEENSIKKIEGLQNCLNLQKSGPWKLHRDQAPGVTGVQVSVIVKQKSELYAFSQIELVPDPPDLRVNFWLISFHHEVL